MSNKGKPYIILTGGDGGYGNLGDEWLADAVRARYQTITDKFRVVLLQANAPNKSLPGFHWVADNLEALSAENIPLDNIAAVHYYGGGYLNTYWAKAKLWLYRYLTKAGLSPEKIFFTGLGLGPFTGEQAAEMKAIAEKVAFFGTRDNNFAEFIDSEFMFDESVYLSSKPKQNAIGRKKELWVNIRMADHVGASAANASTFLGRVIRLAEVYNLRVKCFSMIKNDSFDEGAEMERLLRSIGSNYSVRERAGDYKQLMAQFSRAALVITTSYHATLASLYCGVPVVSLYDNEYYDLKFRGLKGVLDTELLTNLNLSAYSIDELLVAIKASDPAIDTKITSLKEASDRAYDKYYDFLGVDRG